MSRASADPAGVLHYSELGTKGRNRLFFERCLKENLLRSLEGLPVGPLRSLTGRLILELKAPLNPTLRAALEERLGSVIGLAHFAFVDRIGDGDFEALTQRVVELARALPRRS